MDKGLVLFTLLFFGSAAGPAGCGSESPDCDQDTDCPAGRYCQVGTCAFDCTLDGECPDGYRCTARGRCELGCVRTNNGLEACDGIDNDCDDAIDEDWTELGQPCAHDPCPPGLWVCAPDGQAVLCDGTQPTADDATCDGFDDDCDGITDDEASERACPLQAGVCAGAAETCQPGGSWSGCDYGPDHTPDSDAVCDQQDNDCDGQTDEDAEPIAEPEIGPQSGDGQDNNCNGIVDEPGGVMVRIDAATAIDAYELSVFTTPDCSGPSYGQASDDYPAEFPAEGPASVSLYACSLPGRIPSGWLSWYRASRACAAQGKRLCTASEYRAACAGAELTIYPYGNALVSGACNDGWGAPSQVAQAGAYADCESGSGAHDMSGNLTEWVSDDDPRVPGHKSTGGGSFACIVCYEDETCRDCVRDNVGDQSKFRYILDCQPGPSQLDEDLEGFAPAWAEAWMGSRCCLDLP